MSDAKEQLYREYASLVYRFLLNLTHDAETAEELTQETFYRALKGLDEFRNESKLSVWLCQIAKHAWYQELKRRKKQSAVALTEDIEFPLSVEGLNLASDEKQRLFRAIHKLNEPMREVVYLRLTGDLSFAEIGALLGKNENWARVTFFRAKQTLMEDF